MQDHGVNVQVFEIAETTQQAEQIASKLGKPFIYQFYVLSELGFSRIYFFVPNGKKMGKKLFPTGLQCETNL